MPPKPKKRAAKRRAPLPCTSTGGVRQTTITEHLLRVFVSPKGRAQHPVPETDAEISGGDENPRVPDEKPHVPDEKPHVPDEKPHVPDQKPFVPDEKPCVSFGPSGCIPAPRSLSGPSGIPAPTSKGDSIGKKKLCKKGGLPVPSSPLPGPSGIPAPTSKGDSIGKKKLCKKGGLPVPSSPLPGPSGIPAPTSKGDSIGKKKLGKKGAPPPSGLPAPSSQPGSGLSDPSPRPDSSEATRRSTRSTRFNKGFVPASTGTSSEEEFEPYRNPDEEEYIPDKSTGDGSGSNPDMDIGDAVPIADGGDGSGSGSNPDMDIGDAVPIADGGNGHPSNNTPSTNAAADVAMGSSGGETYEAWSRAGWNPRKIPFTGEPGPNKCELDAESDPVSFFELYATDELLEYICTEINRYAAQSIAQVPELLPYSRLKKWEEVHVIELKNFLGLYFNTGLVKKPTLESYWSRRPNAETPHFRRTMKLSRFLLIKRFLHFSNQETPNTNDRLYKVRHVLDSLLEKFRTLYIPNKNISIDEGIMAWKGRLAFKTYNPMKPTKWGLKSYCLSESETGYLWNMQPYTGPGQCLNMTVMGLLGELSNKGYHLYMDNYYNSVDRCMLLQSLGTQVCGTLRKHRGEPPEIKQVTRATHLRKGETISCHNNAGVMVLAWHDKKIVKMCNTIHPDEMVTVIQRKKGQAARVEIQKPACIAKYNKYMNGVDKTDQKISYYPFTRKTLKWPVKFIFYLFELTLLNAFVLQTAKQGKAKTMLEYITLVVEKWTSLRPPRQEEEEVALPPIPARSRSGNLESRTEVRFKGHELVKMAKKRDCRLHLLTTGPDGNGLRHSTMYCCPLCEVPLCVPCYFVYHTEENLEEYFADLDSE